MEIRLATTEDKDEVLALNNNIYDGRDYLPAYYDFYLKCPVAIPCVIALYGEIIGYQCGFVIDNGDTMVYRASRISPKFQGKGYYKILSQYVTEEARKRYTLQRTTKMVSSANLKVQTDSFRKKHTFICTKAIFMFTVLPVQLSRCTELLSVPDRNKSIHAVSAYLDAEVIRNYLFPEGRMIVDWIPYRLLPSNLDLIDPNNTVCASDVKVNEGIASGLLSIGTFYKVYRPKYTYKLDLYGTDVNSIQYHMRFHLGFIAKTLDDLVSVLVFADKEFQKGILLDSFAEYEVDQRTGSDNQVATFQLLFESAS